MTNKLYLVSGAILTTAALLIIYISYLLLWPVQVLTLNKMPTIEPSSIQSGQIVNLKYDYCKHRDLESNITIDFIGKYVIPSLSTKRHFPVGCHVADLPVIVPVSAPTGDYSLRISVVYKVNPLKTKQYEFDSEKFHVEHSPTSSQVVSQ